MKLSMLTFRVRNQSELLLEKQIAEFRFNDR